MSGHRRGDSEIPWWEIQRGDSPLVAAAIHSGHHVPPRVGALMAIDPADRLREEDPFTGEWTAVADNRIVARHSRFLADLNRSRDQAVYVTPADAWGLTVWKQPPAVELTDGFRRAHDAFYADLKRLYDDLEKRWGRFVVLDLHAYNHRRRGPDAPVDDPQQNPEINIGTGTMDRERWAPVVDRFIADLRAFDFQGRHLDVRENVKFVGKEFPRWAHEVYPDSACVLAVEVKKIFMDEWTGVLYPDIFESLLQALKSTVPGLLASLSEVKVAGR